MKIDQQVLQVLSNASVDGHMLFLNGQLDRNLYTRTNKVLEAAGGKWNRKAKAHVFEQPASDRVEQMLLTGDIVVPQDFGYRSEEHTSELQSLMRISYAGFCLKKKKPT